MSMCKQPDPINHPPHYAGYPVNVECIDITRHLNFQLGNAFKYVWRAGKKGGPEQEIEDLKKALWYLTDVVSNHMYIQQPAPEAVAIFQLAFAALPDDDAWSVRAALNGILSGSKKYISITSCLITDRIEALEGGKS